MFEMLLEFRPKGVAVPLKTVLLSGDAIRMDFAASAIRELPGTSIVALGGATEASIWSNYHVVTPASAALGTTLVPYGMALSNQTLYVLDEHQQPRPLGAVGMIFIGGIGLARGYLRRPDLTSERFLLHPSLGRIYDTVRICTSRQASIVSK